VIPGDPWPSKNHLSLREVDELRELRAMKRKTGSLPRVMRERLEYLELHEVDPNKVDHPPIIA